MKKLLLVLLLVMSFGIGTNAFAATTSQAQPVASIGTYNDFGQSIRLQWKPVYGATNGYKVYLVTGYNVRKGFVLQHALKTYALVYNGRQWWLQDYVSAPKMGQWYTIMVTAVDKNGIESTPCYASIFIIR